MEENENWKEPYEDDGLTLGSAEALQREIEKNKALKVERLQLRNQMENLRIVNDNLTRENKELHQANKKLSKPEGEYSLPGEVSAVPPGNAISQLPKWSIFLLIFNLLAAGFFLFLFLQK